MMISNQIRQFFSTPRPAQITLAGKESESTFDCQLSITGSDVLLVHLIGTTLSSLSLNMAEPAYCFCVASDTVYHFYAQIDKVLAENELQLTIEDVTSYPQRRRFFRVDAEVCMQCWPAQENDRPRDEAKQKKVNLSAVGLRFKTTKPLKLGEKVALEIQLSQQESSELLRCDGRVVRVDLDKNQRVEEVAIDLEGIKSEEQEKLIKFCLAEQRRQIRLKVKILNPASS